VILSLIFALPAAAAGQSGIDESFFVEGGPLDRPMAAAPSGATTPGLPEIAPGGAASLAESGFKVVGALFFVSLLIVTFYKIGRKAKLPFFAGSEHVRRIATEAIGPNQFISIVEVAGKVLVLGVSEKGLSTLTELEGEAADRLRLAEQGAEEATEVSRRPFRAVLAKVAGHLRGDLAPSPAARFDEICGRALAEERRRMEGLRI
jgi:flagellar biogenesis protein FliO